MNFSPGQNVYELRTLLLDIELKDVRQRSYRAASGKLRPYLTIVFAPVGSFVAAYSLSPEPPNQRSISALLFRAMTQTEAHPFGGIPKEIRFDGSAAPSKGGGEQFLEMLQARLREALSDHRGPIAEAANPTLDELEHILKDCLAEYHRSATSEWKQSRLAAHRFPGASDPRRLATLLGEGVRRAVTSTGILYHTRRYWHDELASLPPGTEVIIYPTPSLTIPKSVEVFHQGTWVCTASIYKG